MALSVAGIRIATPDDEAAVVETVVASFAADPALRYFFPTDEEYATQGRQFVGALFQRIVTQEALWILPDAKGNVASVAMWTPAHADAHGTSLDALTDEQVARLKRYGEATHGGLPDSGFCYLAILATHPDHWGNGYGREMMKPGLAQAETGGHAAYLETATAQNVAMYQRAGWHLTSEHDVVDGLKITVLAVQP